MNFKTKGFTLIELLVVIAIIAVVTTISFGVFGFERTTRFDSDVQKTLAALRRVQNDSKTVQGNREYGMQFMANSWISFYQDPATGARTNIDTQPLGAASLAWSMSDGTDQVVFERLTGKPKGGASGSLNFTLSNPSRASTIRIENTGVIYEQ